MIGEIVAAIHSGSFDCAGEFAWRESSCFAQDDNGLIAPA
jgi:hypothetical protein